jgi:hypothetical protein
MLAGTVLCLAYFAQLNVIELDPTWLHGSIIAFVNITHRYSFSLLMDIWIVSSLGLLWVNLDVQVFLCICVLISLPRSRGVESLSHRICVFNFMRNCQKVCAQWLCHFDLTPVMFQSTRCSTFCFICIASLFNFSHGDGCETLSHCSFLNLHFHNDHCRCQTVLLFLWPFEYLLWFTCSSVMYCFWAVCQIYLWYLSILGHTSFAECVYWFSPNLWLLFLL